MATATKPSKAKQPASLQRTLSGDIPNTNGLEELLVEPTRQVARTASATSHSKKRAKNKKPKSRTASTESATKTVSPQLLPGARAAAPLTVNMPAQNMAGSKVRLYPTSNELNQIDTRQLTPTAPPLSSSNNMPPAYNMTGAVIPSAPPLSSSNNMPPAYNMTGVVIPSAPPMSDDFYNTELPPPYTQAFNGSVQNLHQKWTAKLKGNLESSVFRSYNTIISEENMTSIRNIMNKFGSTELVYEAFTKQVLEIYKKAVSEKRLTDLSLNTYISAYLKLFGQLLDKFGEGFITLSDTMQYLLRVNYDNQFIISDIRKIIKSRRVTPEGFRYLVEKQDKLNSFNAVIKHLNTEFISKFRPNITYDQIIYFALYLNDRVHPDLYFGLWNDFHDYTKDIRLYDKFIIDLNTKVHRLGLRHDEFVYATFMSRLRELFANYIPAQYKKDEQLVLKNDLLNYLLDTIKTKKTIPELSYFLQKKKQKEILKKLGMSDLLRGGARQSKRTVKKRRGQRNHTMKKLIP